MNLFERAQKYTGELTRLPGGKGGEMKLDIEYNGFELYVREDEPIAFIGIETETQYKLISTKSLKDLEYQIDIYLKSQAKKKFVRLPIIFSNFGKILIGEITSISENSINITVLQNSKKSNYRLTREHEYKNLYIYNQKAKDDLDRYNELEKQILELQKERSLIVSSFEIATRQKINEAQKKGEWK